MCVSTYVHIFIASYLYQIALSSALWARIFEIRNAVEIRNSLLFENNYVLNIRYSINSISFHPSGEGWNLASATKEGC